LIFDAKGNLYGTTAQGGETGNGYANGTVFKVSKSGKETVLYRFGGGAAAGANPYAGLIMDAKGNLYGTTANAGDGFGDEFELSNVGKVTVLYSFPGDGREGETPQAGLVMDAKGNLYGTTYQGGPHVNAGVVFKLSK